MTISRLVLEENGCPPEYSQKIERKYTVILIWYLQRSVILSQTKNIFGFFSQDYRDRLLTLLQRTRFNLPQLVGVTWRLDHIVRYYISVDTTCVANNVNSGSSYSIFFRSKFQDRLHRPLFLVRIQIISVREASIDSLNRQPQLRSTTDF